MPQLRSLVALLLAATAVAAVAVAGAGKPGFVVTGRVYCDNCRAGFETNVSHNIQGATVSMECRHFETQKLHDKAEATTDAGGWYRMDIGLVFHTDPTTHCSSRSIHGWTYISKQI
ncbi:hypothetical protein PVAP13_3KG081516 [Panicum virgatum]|uniref:Uncharacterized protein n=1 Tax=Panicum virgatum TaxID=38727 RepID=A0A8T0USN1_PANVG|nr:hypothetical protein PVAP13_3KG081516 [Panicum virgatum]